MYFQNSSFHCLEDSYKSLLSPARNSEYQVPPRTSFLSIIPEAPAALAFLPESGSTSEFWVGTKSSSLVKMKSPCWDTKGRLFMFLIMSVTRYFPQLCFFSSKTLHQCNLLGFKLFMFYELPPFPAKSTTKLISLERVSKLSVLTGSPEPSSETSARVETTTTSFGAVVVEMAAMSPS